MKVVFEFSVYFDDTRYVDIYQSPPPSTPSTGYRHWRQSNHQCPLCWWHRWLSRRGRRTDKIGWAFTFFENFNIANFLDTINVINVRLCMMVLLFEVYLFILFFSVLLSLLLSHRCYHQSGDWWLFSLQCWQCLHDLLRRLSWSLKRVGESR